MRLEWGAVRELLGAAGRVRDSAVLCPLEQEGTWSPW